MRFRVVNVADKINVTITVNLKEISGGITMSPEKMPCVSVGVPVYNGEAYLGEALDCVLAQSFDDFEVIISDNASTDRTGDICREYALKDSRIRYVRHSENFGGAFNNNHVVELSCGKYFKWAHHDDLIAPEFLKRCVDVLENAPSHVVLCYPKTTIIDQNGAEMSKYQDNLDIRFEKPQDRIRHLFFNIGLCHAGLGLIRMSALKKTRLIGNFPHADVVLLYELSLQGEFWEVPEYLFCRRLHSESSQADRKPEDISEWFDPANKGKHILPNWRLFIELLKAISRSSLDRSERVCCYALLARLWIPKYWRVMGGEIKIILKDVLLCRQAGTSRVP